MALLGPVCRACYPPCHQLRRQGASTRPALDSSLFPPPRILEDWAPQRRDWPPLGHPKTLFAAAQPGALGREPCDTAEVPPCPRSHSFKPVPAAVAAVCSSRAAAGSPGGFGGGTLVGVGGRGWGLGHKTGSSGVKPPGQSLGVSKCFLLLREHGLILPGFPAASPGWDDARITAKDLARDFGLRCHRRTGCPATFPPAGGGWA